MGRKEREQKRVRRGRDGKGGRGKTRARTRGRFLANQHADTLEPVQAPVCVGKVKTDTDGLQGFPTVLTMSHEMFRHRRPHQTPKHTYPTFSSHSVTF